MIRGNKMTDNYILNENDIASVSGGQDEEDHLVEYNNWMRILNNYKLQIPNMTPQQRREFNEYLENLLSAGSALYSSQMTEVEIHSVQRLIKELRNA